MNDNKERESDYGPRAAGWLPGDFDANTTIVKSLSDPFRPGVTIEPDTVVMGGIIVEIGSRLHAKMIDAGIDPDEDQDQSRDYLPHMR